MPANLTPDYKAAEAAYKRARDPQDRLDGLRTMLRTIPKHKGTEHMRADIKSRIKELTEALGSGKTGATRTGPATVIRPEGAAQIALVGPPNSGKSSLHARLTGSHTEIGDYPFTTQFPQPGMMPFEDVAIQLIDLPPIAAEHPIPWISDAIQPAAGCLLVVDLAHPGCMAEVLELCEVLRERRVRLVPEWPASDSGRSEPSDDDPFAIVVPTLLVAAKADLLDDPDAEVEVFEELTGLTLPFVEVSAETGENIDVIGPALWERLDVKRVYTKIPGQAADMSRPFTVQGDATIADVAQLVHKDLARSLKYARIWTGDEFDGRQVGPEHSVADGEVVELHV